MRMKYQYRQLLSIHVHLSSLPHVWLSDPPRPVPKVMSLHSGPHHQLETSHFIVPVPAGVSCTQKGALIPLDSQPRELRFHVELRQFVLILICLRRKQATQVVPHLLMTGARWSTPRPS